MARLGLGAEWSCLFANEWSAKKSQSYRVNFPPASELKAADIWTLSTADLPGQADLAWASFPCQDLSLAGNGAGLDGSRSGTLAKFWSLMQQLRAEGRQIPIIALENVVGALTSNGGNDFIAILKSGAAAGYRMGAIVIDAALFLPQSRPRLFLIGVADSVGNLPDLQLAKPPEEWLNPRLTLAVDRLDRELRERWIWWALPRPPRTLQTLNDIIDFDGDQLHWHTREETARLLEMMSPANVAKVRKAKAYRKRIAGTLYKRVRIENGVKAQRAEVRFDQVSGCLRTPVGGSSRQVILVIEGDSARSRLMTPREAARLMGLPDSYRLPERFNDGYHLAGDGVVVPVVRYLSEHLLTPIALRNTNRREEAA